MPVRGQSGQISLSDTAPGISPLLKFVQLCRKYLREMHSKKEVCHGGVQILLHGR